MSQVGITFKFSKRTLLPESMSLQRKEWRKALSLNLTVPGGLSKWAICSKSCRLKPQRLSFLNMNIWATLSLWTVPCWMQFSMYWADYCKTSKKAKVHLGFDLIKGIPCKIHLTNGKGGERPLWRKSFHLDKRVFWIEATRATNVLINGRRKASTLSVGWETAP